MGEDFLVAGSSFFFVSLFSHFFFGVRQRFFGHTSDFAEEVLACNFL